MPLSKEAQERMDRLVAEYDMGESERPPSDAKIMGVLFNAFGKFLKGEKKNGVLDIPTDPRDFLLEAELELLDSINYMSFEIVKLRRLRGLRDEAIKRMDNNEEELTG